jgi:Lysyl oxidase/Bacterial pre-peptidase C-terminal domain/Chitobiase/beta-hexosaminidase C-terminal domain
MRTRIITLLLLPVGIVAHGHDEVIPKIKIIQNGIPLRRLAAEDSGLMFALTLPPGAKELVVKTGGGAGNADLYLRRNAHPTTGRYDFAGQNGGNKETIRVEAPEAGPWYILVDSGTSFGGFDSTTESFRGVKLTATYQMSPGSLRLPKFVPGPGVYAGEAMLRLPGRAKGTTFRYTLDGSEPTIGSTAYEAPVSLATDQRVRVKAFRNEDGSAGPEAEGWFFVVPENEVTPLVSGQALHHRAGKKRSSHLFKITVPTGQPRLQIRVENGPGETDLFLQQGSMPTRDSFTYRGKRKGQTTSIDVTNPAAGDWFIRLQGRTTFSGCSILALVRPPQADLIVWEPVLNPYLSTETFEAMDCEVKEGMITAGTHRLLRFSTETRNIGGVDLHVPTPQERPDLFEFQECHGHYHFLGFASYRLLNDIGEEVAAGRKVSFCLEDLLRWDSASAPDSLYTCDKQGIQAGWSDVYDGGLPGQWIDVTGLTAGVYKLEVTMNPDQVLVESDYTNNTTTIEVDLPGN